MLGKEKKAKDAISEIELIWSSFFFFDTSSAMSDKLFNPQFPYLYIWDYMKPPSQDCFKG